MPDISNRTIVLWTALRGLTLGLLLTPLGCQQGKANPPPPDAARPSLKSESELAAERQQRIASGQVVENASPTVEAEQRRIAKAAKPDPSKPIRGAIQSDIIIINNQTVTVAEVLYPLREKILKARAEQTRRGSRELLERWVRQQVQEEVGTILVHEKAMSRLEDQQKDALARAVDREIALRVARDYGGSQAKLENELALYGLSLERFREAIERRLVVRSYSQETFAPQNTVRREELFRYFEEHPEQFSSRETREFGLIEAPFESFLDAGQTWESAGARERARAKLAAVRHIRAAHEALAARPFEEVAREFSRGPNAEAGGAWGPIGAPLKKPYDELSNRVFEMSAGQTSEPIEGESGWYIVRCGEIKAANQKSFAEAQDEIRTKLREARFNQLASDYVFKLARKATIVGIDEFVANAVQRAGAPNWPRPPSSE